mmetsp:Transcript_31580/g.53056  ORF Transcript_31580/g.53056 Transcript_31580/m.53056 type:complete len:396 (+) Transcript_31580:305-1492(+)
MICALRNKRYMPLVSIDLETFAKLSDPSGQITLENDSKILDENYSCVRVHVQTVKERTMSTSGFPTRNIATTNNPATGVASCSRLVRTMGDPVIQKAMARPGAINKTEGKTAPTDADIILYTVQAKLAGARWDKAHNVFKAVRLGALFGKKPATGLVTASVGAILDSSPKTRVRPPRLSRVVQREKRMSLCLSEAEQVAMEQGFSGKEKRVSLTQAPDFAGLKVKDAQDICCYLTGTYAFAYCDPSRKYVFAARSADGYAPLWWFNNDMHGLIFVNDELIIPEELRDPATEEEVWGEVPPGHLYIGGTGDNPGEMSAFVQFDKGGMKSVIIDGLNALAPNQCEQRLAEIKAKRKPNRGARMSQTFEFYKFSESLEYDEVTEEIEDDHPDILPASS